MPCASLPSHDNHPALLTIPSLQAALPYLTVLTAGSELVAVVRKMCDFTLDAVARRERGEVTTASQELGGIAIL